MKANQVLDLINQRVRNLTAYHLAPVEVGVKLNQNENPFDWPADVKEEVARFCVQRPWNRYPEFVPRQLKEALAAHVGVSADSIVVGNGSNEMLLALLLTFGGPGKTVVICEPTFTVYRLLAEGGGSTAISLRLRNDLSFDVDALCRACREHPGATMIITSPNNPTGSVLREADIRAILDAHQGLLILDQAYVEFGGYDAVGLVKEFPNLIVTRTFSKAMAGAGLRLGYLVGNPQVVGEINKIKLPYNINFFSDHVAQVLLSRKELVQERVGLLMKERDSLYAFLKGLPFDACYPSAANFLLVRTGRKNELFAFLKDRDVLVRDVSGYPMLEGCLRISVGSPEENRVLREGLSAFFAPAP